MRNGINGNGAGVGDTPAQENETAAVVTRAHVMPPPAPTSIDLDLAVLSVADIEALEKPALTTAEFRAIIQPALNFDLSVQSAPVLYKVMGAVRAQLKQLFEGAMKGDF